MIKTFDTKNLKYLFRPKDKSSGEENGQVTIIGGSKLFHGAPILALKTASRIVDMVFFASPDTTTGKVAEQIKSSLMSFVWVPWEETDAYIGKSDAVLIGPGLMRFTSESQNPNDKTQMTNDKEGKRTRDITEKFLKKFPEKRWVIDAGSLQVIKPEIIPPGAIITPNCKEYRLLFNDMPVEEASKKYNCIIILKGSEAIVCSPEKCTRVVNGNPGMTKGGTGDVLAGLVTALYAKNDAFLSATAASYIEKFTADELYKKKGIYYNADDLADEIPESFITVSRKSRALARG